MPKSKERWIEIASGGDGYIITGWDDGFEPVMHEIERYIDAIEEHRLDLNWKEVCADEPDDFDYGASPGAASKHSTKMAGFEKLLCGWF